MNDVEVLSQIGKSKCQMTNDDPIRFLLEQCWQDYI